MNIKQLITNLVLCLALAQGYAWAEDMPAAPDEQNGVAPPVSNVDAWMEETVEDDSYFGMGWESRRSVMQGQGAAGTAATTSRGGGGRGK